MYKREKEEIINHIHTFTHGPISITHTHTYTCQWLNRAMESKNQFRIKVKSFI